MGTSNSYRGPGGGNPLIPSWLEGGSGTPAPEGPAPVPGDGADAPTQPANPDGPAIPAGTVPVQIDPMRYRDSRANLSKFVSTGGSDRRAFNRSVSGYVKRAVGGPKTATKRMGSSRVAAGRLLGFLNDAQSRGLETTLRSLNLGSLVGKPITQLLLGLADYVCPSNGSIDGGIVRDAYAETVAEAIEAGTESLESLTGPQVQTIFESFVANSIFDRLCNDIGAGIVKLSESPKEALSIQIQIKDYIKGAVHDALKATTSGQLSAVNQADVQRATDTVYEQAFSILASFGDS